MNLLVVGASHHTADLSLLERLAVPAGQLPATLAQLVRGEHVTEAVALSTCNRVEVYAGVSAFHGGLAEVSAVLAERAGVSPAALAPHLYVRWDADAVSHALRVAAGLDSLVVGEEQILGQLRSAYTAATGADAVGRQLHELMQQALRVGKRVHAETDLGGAGRSMVSAALDLAAAHLDPTSESIMGSAAQHAAQHARGRHDQPEVLAGRGALVIGAGAMGALAVSGLSRAGAAPVFVANRRASRATRLADAHDATPVPFDDLPTVLASVDVVVSATASPRQVLPAATLEAARAGRHAPLVVCDLALPRDVDPAVADLAGVELIDPDRLAGHVSGPAGQALAEAEQIVAAEAAALGDALRDARVAPTVAALRTRADEAVAAELARLARRRPELTDEQRAEVARTVHRLVQRLLHQPTVRVRQLAARPDGATYPEVLAELFDLQIPQPDRADEVPAIDPEASPGGGT